MTEVDLRDFLPCEVWTFSSDTGIPGVRTIKSLDISGSFILQIQCEAGTFSARISQEDLNNLHRQAML